MATQKDTANKIFEAALEEFSQHGFAGARIDRIAERASVNKAMIYYHFKSKEKLYETIIGLHLDKIRNFFRERIVGHDDPEEIFRSLAEFYNNQLQAKSFIPIFLREMASGGERIKSAFAGFQSDGAPYKIKSLMKNAVENGLFRDIDLSHAIASFIGMNMFYLLMSPLVNQLLEIDDEKRFGEKRAEAVVDLFLNGLKTK